MLKKHQIPLLCVLLVVLTIAAFEPVRHNDFVDYDDETYILLNTHIHSGLTQDSVKWAFTSGYAANWHPLTWLSHMVDIELFNLNPLGHHLHNLALHSMSVVLLFLILKGMTGSVWRSAFVATAFGVHPLRVESVAWAAERKDVLCVFFCMLTLAAYVWYARRGGLIRYGLMILCFCLGLMAKPMIVTLPLVLLLLDIWPLRRLRISGMQPVVPETQAVSNFRLLAEKIPLLILTAVSCVVTYKVQSFSGAVDTLNISLSGRIINACVSYFKYIQKMAAPVDLAPLYPFPENGRPVWMPVAALVVLAVITVWTVYTIREHTSLFVGWFWYIVTLIPVIGLVQIGSHEMADRYSYLPSIGILIMLAWGAYEFSLKWKRGGMICAVAGCVFVLAMIFMTRTQVTYWKDSFSLNKHTLAVTKNNYMAYNNLALVLIDQKKYDQAFSCLQKTLQIRPDYYLANTNMAHLLKEQGRYDEALEYTGRAIKSMPDNGLAWFVQGRVLAAMGRGDDAIKAYTTAAKLTPDDFRFSYDAGLLLAKKGQLQEAIRYFSQCIQSNPSWAEAWRDMGLAQQRLGRIEEALNSYQMVLKLIPNDTITCFRMAVCFEQSGRPHDAIVFYRRAIMLKPDFAQAMDKLAWLLATSPVREVSNPSEAIVLAQKANQIAGQNNYRFMDTLAAAYAANGQFNEAVKTIQGAITLAQTGNDAEAVKTMTTRLELYQKDLPYVENPGLETQKKKP